MDYQQDENKVIVLLHTLQYLAASELERIYSEHYHQKDIKSIGERVV